MRSRTAASRREQVAEAYARLGSAKAVSRETGIPRTTVRRDLKRSGHIKPLSGGDPHGLRHKRFTIPRSGVRRYICTSAQNNTDLHEPTWRSLMALAEYWGAQVLVSRYTYNRHAFTQPEKPDTGPVTDANLWYNGKLAPYFNDERIELAPGLMWCGEMNILPTAVRPLSGLDTYTGRRSGIFPHVKVAMQSLPSGKSEGVKFNFTTGTVTLRNYIQKKAGLKAEFHHVYGALLVEVDSRGRWFCRQLNADSEGVIHDLDLRVANGEVTGGHRVEAINWGDIHVAQMNEGITALAWGKNGMMDALRPRYQFMHDMVDFRARNHHDTGDPHTMFARYVHGADNVRKELEDVVSFMEVADRDYCDMVVVDSNHDSALTRWLREHDYKKDPTNAIFFLEAQLRKYKAIESREDFHMIEWALRYLGVGKHVRFLRPDEQFILLHNQGGGIECGMHGHLGPNGTRGGTRALSRIARRANTGHTHAAEIVDGLYVAGVTASLDHGYNVGPSSWTHSHIVTYPTGKRAIITMYEGAWKAA